MNDEDASYQQVADGLACGKCGAALLGDEPLDGHCLACLLEPALELEEGPADATGFFDHYHIATRTDGTPLQLGRGAMGITFKAFDTVVSSARPLLPVRSNSQTQASWTFVQTCIRWASCCGKC